MKSKAIIIGVLVVLAIVSGWFTFNGEAETKEYISLEECFVKAPNVPYIPMTYILGVAVSEEVYEIVRCESGFDPNAKNPKSTAYGLCQFLDSTWEYVQKKWDMDLNRHSPKNQLYACERLLKEEGLKHWEPVLNCIYEKR